MQLPETKKKKRVSELDGSIFQH